MQTAADRVRTRNAAHAGSATSSWVAERNYEKPAARWEVFSSPDPATRYAHDRRLRIALDRLEQHTGEDLSSWSALVVCGGVGGEGSYLAERGIRDVTVSDFSPRALEHCRRRDPRLETRLLDAEQLDVDDESYDLVLVQDGLHHLPHPTQGLTEMLRVARRAVVVIEPHAGLVARLLGRTWERHGDVVNFVFRWDERMLVQVVRAYLLERDLVIEDLRFWDYTVLLYRLSEKLGSWQLASRLQQLAYRALNACRLFRSFGNMMVAVVVKDPPPGRKAAVTRKLFA